VKTVSSIPSMIVHSLRLDWRQDPVLPVSIVIRVVITDSTGYALAPRAPVLVVRERNGKGALAR
jgi:hypothetical protein